MAKKKVEKKEPSDIEKLVIANNRIVDRIAAINQRIDNIIEAHDKCRKLKGL
jgi:hypothetical protein